MKIAVFATTFAATISISALAILQQVPGAVGFSLAIGSHRSLSTTCTTASLSSLSFQKQSPLQWTTTTTATNHDKSGLSLKMAPDSESVDSKVDPLVQETSVLLRRLSWLAWWSQLILTTVSSVTLLFARNVVIGYSSSSSSSSTLPNFLLAGTGIALSFASIFWTWANRRLSRRMLLLRNPAGVSKQRRQVAASMLRRSIQIGVTLNLFGMLACLISAEQIVGALAIKVLSTSATPARTMALLESSSSLLQPLDIFVVQANTNTLLSHFTSLVALLYMTKSLAKLDPPNDK